MLDFRISLGISTALHATVLIAALIGLTWAPARDTESAINSIDLNFEISDTAQQIAGERDGQRQETPQQRETPRPSQETVPIPPDPTLRPVAPSSNPDPARPDRVADVPAPPQETRSVPTPPPAPTRDQSLVEQQDQEALLRKIEEQRKAEEQAREEAKKEEARKQEEARKREQQRRQEEARRKEEERKRSERFAQQTRDVINNQPGNPQVGVTGTTPRAPSRGNTQSNGRSLTQSQYAQLGELIRSQIAPCWSPPPGTADRGKLIVKIELHMNRDGSLDGRPAVTNQSSDPSFRQVSDSAVRAILICAQRQGGKLNLPVEMYDAVNGWKEIEFAFDPSQMS